MRMVMAITGVVGRLASVLVDLRDPARIRHGLAKLLRQFLLQHVQGWGRQVDADTLRSDPALRVAASSQKGMQALAGDTCLASQPSMSRLVSMLARKKNFERLRRFVETYGMEHLLQRTGGRRRSVIVFDVDALPVDAHGKQLGSKWNGYYKRTIFLPLIAMCGKTGGMLGAELREGTRSVVNGCHDFIRRIAQGLRRHMADKVIVRLDAGFNSGKLCAELESDGIGYVMRLKENAALGRLAEPHLAGGQPPCRQYHELRYGAGSWSAERRVVLVQDPVPGELFARHYFLLTDQDEEAFSAAQLVKLYQQRGKAEKHFGELNAACSMALSSAARPKTHYLGRPVARRANKQEQKQTIRAENEVMLQVFLLVYQIMHVGRCLMQEPEGAHISLSTFRGRVLKVGARFVQHARNIVIHVARSALTAWERFWRRYSRLEWTMLPMRC